MSSDPQTTTYCCERCGQEESELHQIAGKFVCPACSQTTTPLIGSKAWLDTISDDAGDWRGDEVEPPERDIEDCLDCDNPFCAGGRCIEQLHAEARRRDAMWKEVGP